MIKLFEFFRVDRLPTDGQLKLWFESVRHIGDREADAILSAITTSCDSLPRNIPKAFIDHRPGHRSREPCHGAVNPENDPDYPLEFLEKAYHVLAKKGRAEFDAYARAVAMPRTDRERVLAKHELICGRTRIDRDAVRRRVEEVSRQLLASRAGLARGERRPFKPERGANPLFKRGDGARPRENPLAMLGIPPRRKPPYVREPGDDSETEAA